jgi:excisionase family DNA binding protein
MSILSNYTNVTEAAKTLGVHRETIKRLCRSGRIPAEKVHNTWLIAKNDLSVFAASYNGLETWEKKDGGPRS